MSSSENASSTPHVDIDHVARLARLELSPPEREKFSQQFESILGYFERLNAVDVSGVEPTAHALPRHNIWRDDTPGETFSPAQALANAPAQRQNQVLVPKVIE